MHVCCVMLEAEFGFEYTNNLDQDIDILIITLDMVRFDWSDYVIESIVLSAN